MEPTEFGGREGLVQSEADGHKPTAAEQRMLMMQEAKRTE